MTDDDLRKQLATYADAITGFSLVQAIGLIYAIGQGGTLAQYVFQDNGPTAAMGAIILGTTIYCFSIYLCTEWASTLPLPTEAAIRVLKSVQTGRYVAVLLGGALSIAGFWLIKRHALQPHPDAGTTVTRIIDSSVGLQGKGWIDIIALVIGFATFVVVAIYTWLTHKLRVAAQDQITETDKLLLEAQQQNRTSQAQTEINANLLTAAQRQTEISVQPMFAVYKDHFSTGVLRDVVLENVGNGPAFNVSIDQLKWDDNTITIEHGNNVMKPGNKVPLSFHLQEGISGFQLGIEELTHKLRKGQIPAPMTIVVICKNLDLTAYEYYFDCTVDETYFLRIDFAKMVSAYRIV